MSKPRMLRGLLSFSSMTMVSRVFGLIRDITISSVFGVSAATDAFMIAFRIPNFMRRLFAEGSFSTAFVPVFTEFKEKRSHAELKELTSRVAGTLAGVLMLITAVGLIFTPQVAWIFNLGESGIAPGKYQLTIDLLRLTFPFILFVSLTALAGGALNAFHRFGMPALTPVILNLCMIAAALWVAPHLEVPIMALGWAVLFAGILQLLFQLPALAKLDLLVLPRWGWSHPGVRKVMTLMVPTLFGASVAQINLLFDTVVAARLYVGSQTWLSLADRFLELPLGVFGVALGTVILPSLSAHHVRDDRAGFSKAFDWGLRTTLLISVPAAVGLMLLSKALVATVFQHGHFEAFDSGMTAMSVFGLSFGLPSFALLKIVLPAFYARQDTKTPVRAGVAALLANMVFSAILIAVLYAMWATPAARSTGLLNALATTPGLHLALGLASTLASYLNLGLLWFWLRRAGVYERQPGWWSFVVRVGLACAVMAAVVGLGLHLMPEFTIAPARARVVNLIVLVCAGGLVYLLALLALGFRPRDFREH
ncbi:murein biosynthesis integral membrane protein MurJ [Lysobacter sp. TY2-98]|nr:murein biosynthesis integral membrane protein MurJ [Lysobacter sp. TY2-98]